MNAGKESFDFDVNEENELLLQKQKLVLDSNLDSVNAEVNGEGCFVVQSMLRYNVKKSPEETSFTLILTRLLDNFLKACASYTGGQAFKKLSNSLVNIKVNEVSSGDFFTLYLSIDCTTKHPSPLTSALTESRLESSTSFCFCNKSSFSSLTSKSNDSFPAFILTCKLLSSSVIFKEYSANACKAIMVSCVDLNPP